MVERIEYDEFAYFADNASEHGIPYDGPPTVRRDSVALPDGRRLSALVWGDADAEIVLLHGGAQNAHTWDTVALALGRPVVALDLPGHGHSDDARSEPAGVLVAERTAIDVADALRTLVSGPATIVGMSLGGLTSIALAALVPELFQRLVLVDVTPGVTGDKAKAIIDFVRGPATFDSFDDLLARTMEFNPTRTESSLRRGILHNARQLDDGSWMWRHHRDSNEPPAELAATPETEADTNAIAALWDVLGGIAVPVMLVRGMRPQSVVDDADEAELLRRLPDARIEHVENAGHSVQGDTPVELAELILDFIASS
jgi:pimeloyl-ACP methyl ester carboxylesterase